jgi:hypothetical protein
MKLAFSLFAGVAAISKDDISEAEYDELLKTPGLKGAVVEYGRTD